MPGWKARIAGAAYGVGWSALCRLPERWSAAVFRVFADVAWRRQGPRVRTLEGNLRRVLATRAGLPLAEVSGAELRAVSREAMRSYARYWLEDQAAVWVIQRGAGSFTTVMERLEPESVYRRFLAFREGLGMEVLPATGGPNPFRVLMQRLRAGKLVALPCDRDVTGSGIEVEFFGEKALMMVGPAALAVQTGAALMPATLWFEDGRWGVEIHEEIAVPAAGDRRDKAAAMTQQVARIFERAICEHPADWHMLQRVFVADLDPERLAAARAKVGARERAAERNGARTAGGS